MPPVADWEMVPAAMNELKSAAKSPAVLKSKLMDSAACAEGEGPEIVKDTATRRTEIIPPSGRWTIRRSVFSAV
jgi:hypothetical protein